MNPVALLLAFIGGMVSIIAGAVAASNGDDLGPKESWVHFTSFSYSGSDPASKQLTSPEKQYLNPILAGFYPDPSVCRVGDDFYLVNSSFSYYPGVPIFHSRDLINWTQIGYVLNRPADFETLRPSDVSRGVYAPAIRFHDGTFYMVTTLVNGGGNFYVTAKDPAGPWSEPHWVKSVDGIDPSFFFDDDGKAYIVHCGPAPDGKSLYPGHRTIRLREVDLKAASVTGEERILVNGGTDISKKPVWIEGPHLFKRNGKYYLIAAEGGTGYNHSEVVFRADSIWGPYAPFSGNPILTQRDLPPDRADPVTCTGHADFVETSSGRWWAVFLGCRPYERNYFNIGRETFLLPVEWKDDWPIVLPAGQPVPRIADRPDLVASAPAVPTTGSFTWTDDFKADQLNLRWNFLRVPKEQWYSVSVTTGGLEIAPRPVPLTSFQNPSMIACRQEHADFTASTTISVNPQTAPCDAGLVAFQNESHHFFLGVRIFDGSAREVFLEQVAGGKLTHPTTTILASAALAPQTNEIVLKIEAQGRPYSFSYRTPGKEFVPLKEDVNGSLLSTDTAGGFQGVMVGMYARSH